MKAIMRAIAQQPWAIYPSYLPIIAAVAQRRMDAPELVRLREEKGWEPGAVRARPGERLKGTSLVSVRQGVAILPVIGPIIPHADLFAEISGAVSIERMARDLTAALDSEDVRAILLEIDSPGGVAFGVGEFADMVRSAATRKPLKAYVTGMAASAAYWIASAAPEIVVDQSAMLGSVGVVLTTWVQEGPDQDGYREIQIVSSNAANKRPDPRNDAGMAEFRRTLDQLETVFIAAVAKNRGLTTEQVVEEFGRGAVEIGRNAVEKRMADRVGTFEQVLAELAAARPAVSTISAAAAAQPQEQHMSKQNEGAAPAAAPAGAGAPAAALTVEQVTQQHPQAATVLRAEGATAERARVKGILGSEQAKGRGTLAAHLAFETDMSAEAATKILGAAPAEQPAAVPATTTAPAAPGADLKPPANLLAVAMKDVKNPNVGADAGGGGDEVSAEVAKILNAGNPKAAA